MKLLKLKDPIIEQKYNTIFIITDKFTKWRHFITYIEEILAKDMAQVYIKEVFVRYGVLNKIYISILANIYSRTRHQDSNIYSLSPIDR